MPVVTGNTYFRTNHPGRCLLQRLIHTIGQFAMRVFVATVKSDSTDATRNSKSEMRGRANFPDRFGELGWLFERFDQDSRTKSDKPGQPGQTRTNPDLPGLWIESGADYIRSLSLFRTLEKSEVLDRIRTPGKNPNFRTNRTLGKKSELPDKSNAGEKIRTSGQIRTPGKIRTPGQIESPGKNPNSRTNPNAGKNPKSRTNPNAGKKPKPRKKYKPRKKTKITEKPDR